MLNFYEQESFRLFPCNIDKTPRVKSWRSTEAHITTDKAQDIMDTGGYVGAWVPPNYVIIDVDMNHVDKLGNVKPEGLPIYTELLKDLRLPCENPLGQTLTIKTGSGGFHLYFKLPDTVDYSALSQKSIAESVDVRTHRGYVIASGTNGYSIYHEANPLELPEPLLGIIRTRAKEKAKDITPSRELSPEMLQKVLSKLDPCSFDTNDIWQEFITSCIAASGNGPAVLGILEEWSKSDPSYAKDDTVRKRIETFEPNGGITVGTFL